MAVNVWMLGHLLRPGLYDYTQRYREHHSPVLTELVATDDGLLFRAEHSVIGRIESLLPVEELASIKKDTGALVKAFRAHMAIILPEYIFPDEAVIGYDI